MIGLFSIYVPGETFTVSPVTAIPTAAFIVCFARSKVNPSLVLLPFLATYIVFPGGLEALLTVISTP